MTHNTPEQLQKIIEESKCLHVTDNPSDECVAINVNSLMMSLTMFLTSRDHEIWQDGYDKGKHERK